jgi:hypothetical protein
VFVERDVAAAGSSASDEERNEDHGVVVRHGY